MTGSLSWDAVGKYSNDSAIVDTPPAPDDSSTDEYERMVTIAPWQSVTLGTILALAGPVGAALSALSLYLIVRPLAAARTEARLRPMELVTALLSANDFCLALATCPVSAISLLGRRWLFGALGCHIHAFVCFLFGYQSLLAITLMAVTRYVVVCHPRAAAALLTSRRIACTGICLCAYSALWATLPLAEAWGSYALEPHRGGCSLDWTRASNASFIVAIFVAVFVTPIGVIAFCYTSILVHIRRSAAVLSKGKVTSFAPPREPPLSCKTVHHSTERFANTTKVIVMVGSSFIVCWSPYAVVSFNAAFGFGSSRVSPVILAIPAILCKLSPLANGTILLLTSRYHKTQLGLLVQRISYRKSVGGGGGAGGAGDLELPLTDVKRPIGSADVKRARC